MVLARLDRPAAFSFSGIEPSTTRQRRPSSAAFVVVGDEAGGANATSEEFDAAGAWAGSGASGIGAGLGGLTGAGGAGAGAGCANAIICSVIKTTAVNSARIGTTA